MGAWSRDRDDGVAGILGTRIPASPEERTTKAPKRKELRRRGLGSVHDSSGGCNAVLSRSLEGCATVAVGPPRADPRSRHNEFSSTLKGSAKRHVERTPCGMDAPYSVGRLGRRGPGVALCLPPATSGQAFSLQSRPPTPATPTADAVTHLVACSDLYAVDFRLSAYPAQCLPNSGGRRSIHA